MYATGPEMLEEVQRMCTHPTGRRILADRPDLAAFLANPSALASMPQGSLGRAFHDAMNVEGGVPGYMLAGLIYSDGFFDSYEMPDDARTLSYLVAVAMVLDLRERQALLEAVSTVDRLRAELALLGRETRLMRELPSLPAIDLARTPSRPN